RDGPRFRDGDTEAKRIGELAGARAIPTLVYAGAIGVRGRFLGTPIYGIDAGGEPTPFHVVDGRGLAAGDPDGVLVGSSLAKRLGLAVGDTIDLRAIFGPIGGAIDSDNVGRFRMTIRGIVVGSAGGYRFVFVDRAFLGHEAGDPHAASTIIVHLDDHEAAREVAARIDAGAPEAQALAWRDDDPYLPNYLRANRIINDVSYAMVIAAISVPVWALLYIHVLNRRRELGILAALGFGRREIFAIYSLQALVVSVVGYAVGALFGYALIRYFHANPIFEWEGLVARPVATFDTFFAPGVIIVATALVAGAYPAWSASRTDPAKVLRRLD
ncbi:MAG TPA: FtsX-like permease family protein, partial [Kofleriaceae bacterium]|nr:FtsX-like permease family protein [Kofleriaceae bacterium]